MARDPHGRYNTESVADSAIRAMWKRDRAGVVDELMRLVETPPYLGPQSAGVKAAKLLGKLGDGRAIPLLERIAEAEGQPDLGEAARRALAKLGNS
jgi:hypothetical protein